MKNNGKSSVASLLLSLLMFNIINFNHNNNTKIGFVRGDENTTQAAVVVNVGVVVDYEKGPGKMGLSCVEMAVAEFYDTHARNRFKTRLAIHSADSKSSVVGAASAALHLIKNVEVQAIIGPLASSQAVFMVELGKRCRVPVISFSASSSSLELGSSYFFQATQNQTFQVKPIASIVHHFGWRQVAAIYVDNDYGEGLIPLLSDELQSLGARLSYRTPIPVDASDDRIAAELYKLMTMQTRVFVVHAHTSLGPKIFAKAKEIGMMEKGYVWIATNVLANYYLSSTMDPSVADAMQGVIGIRTYVPYSPALRDFEARWRSTHSTKADKDSELNVYGLWAYDAATALAIAVEEAWHNSGSEGFGFDKTNTNGSNYTDLEMLGVSRNGPNLRKALLGVPLKGLTGSFSLRDGHLQSLTFEIVNVDGNVGRRVGFWTPQSGLVQSLEMNNSVDKLGRIVWPGQSSSVPKGWEIPTNRQKLRIGVPKKEGFMEFLEIKNDSKTNNTIVSGYCIDVFEAVMKELPYHIDYEFIPFTKPMTNNYESYDELVYQVSLGKFDAVVGDTTIRANRSNYVDFTLPYTESGVSMIVPVTDKQGKNRAWIFLKPLSLGLWLTTIAFFGFIAFVVWVLEHRVNEEFRGPVSHEIGTSLWFSFSTMVYAHRERLTSNLARAVVIIWLFAVLIITQSYSASLTSSLTVQKLQPTINDMTELIKTKQNVGYIYGSFIREMLIELGFSEEQLKIYKSPEECDDLFFKKKDDGGIAAAIDEIPYIKLLLAKYCSKYTMVEPTLKTGGFGFVFPRGSPLVADVSKAILKVTEDKTMNHIENKWFGQQTRCLDPNPPVSYNSLGLESFWGLFVIVGAVSIFTLVWCFFTFFYEQRRVLLSSDTPLRTRIHSAFRLFDQRDLSSHTFKRKSDHLIIQDSNTNESVIDDRFRHPNVIESLPQSNGKRSSSSYTNPMAAHQSPISFHEEEHELSFSELVTTQDEHGQDQNLDQEIMPRVP